ncbi:phage capsid protein [Vibrio parahaemolyticus]|uniref:GPO family capsid scaffolding protein n=1 Tax=Vibrio parahaemolyticus TaxID=670 RepID=UPI00084B48DF|nr:GPO family capsid scaffolding protein [Vibrio parahaemolyticus]EGQ7792761.1 phage capsid protein [Vibrio parahaemolyticus]EGQ7809343.1 phage capsid protein [Vibrio parahaemolyticus]EIV8648088.1 GPO family capsid scaffolding protein [Vibrio parahaemolyticus]EJE4732848.1 GPO family capsid scaffolding protein [Vibrio parahaemolyticus]EJG1114339.1 GPO family capsid scaffolding protein [Vibrio parahaemolyticus]
MAKISDWKIVATEGPTVDGRKITREWLTQIAESYAMTEYTALIWPEHKRFGGYGSNWGKVVDVKAEEVDGKMRLFAKLEPNQYLLEANKLEQKLFTSIEPNPDYKGQGKCYLMGIAVTDSPASSGTSILKFSRQEGETTELQCSQLEELNLDECYSRTDRFFAMCSAFFNSGDDEPEPIPAPEPEEENVTEDQLKAALQEQFGIMKSELKDELKKEFNLQAPEPPQESEEKPEQFSVQQFSEELQKHIAPVMEKVNGLETQFAELKQEKPGQKPGEEGNGGDDENKFNAKDMY